MLCSDEWNIIISFLLLHEIINLSECCKELRYITYARISENIGLRHISWSIRCDNHHSLDYVLRSLNDKCMKNYIKLKLLQIDSARHCWEYFIDKYNYKDLDVLRRLKSLQFDDLIIKVLK
ncbi:hypothetical protein D3C87_853110 [compost metagenome]